MVIEPEKLVSTIKFLIRFLFLLGSNNGFLLSYSRHTRSLICGYWENHPNQTRQDSDARQDELLLMAFSIHRHVARKYAARICQWQSRFVAIVAHCLTRPAHFKLDAIDGLPHCATLSQVWPFQVRYGKHWKRPTLQLRRCASSGWTTNSPT